MASPATSPELIGSQLRATRRGREIKIRNTEPTPQFQTQSVSSSRGSRLYEKDAETNLLNFVDFLSEEEVVVLREIPLVDFKLVGSGSSMEVCSVAWKRDEPRVAVKRMKRDTIPKRSANLPIEHDTAYAKAVKLFYHDVKSIMQEILVMSREPLSSHRNIVRLLAVSWDDNEEYFINHLFPPLMVIELAHEDTPTLTSYYEKKLDSHSHAINLGFIADIADGLSALHMCGVIHGDLKPENVLLFHNPAETGSLIAKLGDFGFANINQLREPVRGSSEYWAAPERIEFCPESIKAELEDLDTPECVSDIYSFGLVASFIALDGIQPLSLPSTYDKRTNTEDANNKLKFADRTRFMVAEKIMAHYNSSYHESDAKPDLSYAYISLLTRKIRSFYKSVSKIGDLDITDLSQTYTSLIYDTLQSLPSKRIASLSAMRLRIIGSDPFARQRHEDKFKVRPFNDAFKQFSTLQNIFSKGKYPFSNKVIESLPLRVKEELLDIVGKTSEFGETQLHLLRRLRLQNIEDAKAMDEEQKQPDNENVKVSIDGLIQTIASVKDLFDMYATIGVGQQTLPSAELDFLGLADSLRPPLFTFIDGNNTSKARNLLQQDSSLANEVIPEFGWTPLHLAACEGRTKSIKMLISEYGVDPNVRCIPKQRCTPLHQAIIAYQVKAVKLLLELGSNMDARLKDEGRYQYTSLGLAMQNCLTGDPSKENMEIIRLLLKNGADYLQIFDGHPIIFSAVKYTKLLKLFFDCIGEENSRLVANSKNADGETMFHVAVIWARFDAVKLLLEKGADAGTRDIGGHTAYVKLLNSTSLKGSAYFAPIQVLTSIALKKGANLGDADKVLALLKEKGGEACAIDDEIYSKEEVEKLQSKFKLYPQIGKIYNPKRVAKIQDLMHRYFISNSPMVTKLNSIREEHIFLELARSLAIWDENRKEGLISSDELPGGWSEFLDEANRETDGLLISWMEADEIPQITKLLKDKTISTCQWVVERNGIEILIQLTRIMQEAIYTGALGKLEEHVASLGGVLPALYQEGFQISNLPWITRIFVLQRLKQIWKAINRGEILDLLYELAVMVNVHDSFDSLDDYTLFQPLRSGARTPAWVLEALSLPRKYPGATIFVTTQNIHILYTRISLFFVQLIIFLYPCMILLISTWVFWRQEMYENIWTVVIWPYFWKKFIPAGWTVLGMNYRVHPNVICGLQTAWELLIFRLCHWFALEEPLILSFNAKFPSRISMSDRLDSMRKDALYPVYWLSCKPNTIDTPVPCYRATGELMTKWKDGRLPRKAWRDGWWELQGNDKKVWKRVDITEHPTWSQYSKASQRIKEILLAKKCDDVYREFLDIRDYYLEPAAGQISAMDKLFGTKHAECTNIWKSVFIDNSDPNLRPNMKKKKLGWLERLVAELGVDRIRDLITYTWDGGLLDKNGGAIPKREFVEDPRKLMEGFWTSWN